MIHVAPIPQDAQTAEITVVIDVLRASSTIVQAFGGGYRRVSCTDTLDRARSLASPGRVLAGEIGCVPPEDFELGNSPAEVLHPRGDELVLATTNGAPAIVRAAELSRVVLVGALLNLDALVAALKGAGDVQLLCAGTGGSVSVEDTYVAGRIAAQLPGPRSDAALVACAVARAYPNARAALGAGQARRLLEATGLLADVDWCARESVVAIVPRVATAGQGMAVLESDRQTSMLQDKNIAGMLSLIGVRSGTGQTHG